MEAAAQEGDIDALYVLISQIPDVLEDMDEKSFVETPLHIAASRGHTEFALEIMRLKPSFAHKANKDGFTPMHVALHNNKTETVLGFLDFDVNLVRVKGKEGVTPLHYVAQEEHIDLLIRFLSACPKSLEDVTVRKETALHIALKNNKLEAFKVMIRWLEIGCKEILCSEKKILNRRDNQGKTILELARSRAEAAQLVSFLANSRVGKYLDGPNAALHIQIDNGQVGAEPLDAYIHLLRTDQRLKKAAEQGDTDAMYAILGEDPYILEGIDQVPFIDTPLHVAASAGKARFAHDILRLKPSFGKKLNRDGYSPLHLALQKNHSEIVLMLLGFDKELVHVQGKDGITPLHYASQLGNAQYVLSLIEACPKSIEDQTASGETALHVAVRKDQLNSLKILCGWLQRAGGLEILDQKNHKSQTAWDIAMENSNPSVIKVMKACGAGKKKSRKALAADTIGRQASIFERAAYLTYRSKLLISDNHRNMLLVVAALIVTATYQAVLSPPPLHNKNSTNADNTHSTTATDHPAMVPRPTPPPPPAYLTLRPTPPPPPAYPTLRPDPRDMAPSMHPTLNGRWAISLEGIFGALNSVAFLISLSQILQLLPGGRWFIYPVALLLAFSYWIAVSSINGYGSITLFAILYLIVFCWALSPLELVFHQRLKRVKPTLCRKCQRVKE